MPPSHETLTYSGISSSSVSNPQSALLSLPSEIILRIFESLSARDLYLAVRPVSRVLAPFVDDIIRRIYLPRLDLAVDLRDGQGPLRFTTSTTRPSAVPKESRDWRRVTGILRVTSSLPDPLFKRPNPSWIRQLTRLERQPNGSALVEFDIEGDELRVY